MDSFVVKDGTPPPACLTTATVPAATGAGAIILTANAPGCCFSYVNSKAEEQAYSSDPLYSYPYGLVEFGLTCPAPDSSADVSITFPGGAAGMTYRKYGPTTPDDDMTTSWYTFDNITITGPNSITLHLKDGELGDDTGADGIIVDQGGPGRPNNDPVAIPTMTEWGMMFFVLLAGLVSIYYLTRRKRI